jgi:hypothetical protein
MTAVAKPRADDAVVNLNVRMPELLRRQLVAEAESAKRSLNSEVLWRLGQTFSPEWQRFIAGIAEEQDRQRDVIDQLLQNPRLQQTLRELIAQVQPAKGKP